MPRSKSHWKLLRVYTGYKNTPTRTFDATFGSSFPKVLCVFIEHEHEQCGVEMLSVDSQIGAVASTGTVEVATIALQTQKLHLLLLLTLTEYNNTMRQWQAHCENGQCSAFNSHGAMKDNQHSCSTVICLQSDTAPAKHQWTALTPHGA